MKELYNFKKILFSVMKSGGDDQVKEEPLSDDEEGAKRMEAQDAGEEDGPCSSSSHTSVRQM